MRNKVKTFFNLKIKGIPVCSFMLFASVWLFLLYCNLDLGALGVNDDVVIYRRLTEIFTLKQIPIHLYNTWSSRTLIEINIVFFSMIPVAVWAVVNSIIMMITLFLLVKFVDSNVSFLCSLITSMLFLSIQWQHMSTAGWIATTLNYLWTSAAGLFALYILFKQSLTQKAPLLIQILSVLILLYSINMELNVAFHVIVTLSFAVYLFVAKKAIPKLIYAHVAAIILSLIYISLSPGVDIRFATEIDGFFPDMMMRGFAQNIEMGISAAMRTFLFERDMLFLSFCLIITIAVFKINKNVFYRLISICPLLATICFGVFKSQFLAVMPIFTFIPQSVTQEGIITFANAGNFISHIPFFVICAVITCIIISLYIIFGHNKMAVLAIVLFCAGFATAAAVGFTPVVWASGGRTAMIFMLCKIALISLIYKNIQNKKNVPMFVFYFTISISCAIGAYNFLTY